MRHGISSTINDRIRASYVSITIWDEESYLVENRRFKRGAKASDKHLSNLSEQIVAIFRQLERAVNKSVPKRLTLSPTFCQEQLVALAQLGRRAYQRFFPQKAQQALARRFQTTGVPAPTFISEVVPFPWEVLYEGSNYHDGAPNMFWGFQYAPARILSLDKDLYDHVLEQPRPSDMLFCLHHQLRHAHQQELSTMQKIVKSAKADQFNLFASRLRFKNVSNGETLLEYLDSSTHNMLHFACHCRPCENGIDALLFSLLDEPNPRPIQLETVNFEDIDGQFQRQPLVFLNACQSAGGTDDLRKAFNFPQMFYERQAAAIIATACPVPDIFAAEFARVFYAFFLQKPDMVQEIAAFLQQQGVLKDAAKIITAPITIGQALRLTRWYFLKKHHNPLGLAYGLYSPAHYRVAGGLAGL